MLIIFSLIHYVVNNILRHLNSLQWCGGACNNEAFVILKLYFIYFKRSDLIKNVSYYKNGALLYIAA
jgi:hypothetical protein